MALTIVEIPRAITGGVDTHLDTNVAAALDDIGGLLGVDEFTTDLVGHRRLLAWLETFGTVACVGVEGTGSYGVGLARSLRAAGIAVVEVDRPNRLVRRRQGKSDPLDAVEAARAVLSGRASGEGKSRDGNVEAIRALAIAKRSARSTKIKSLNQIRHLGFGAPEPLRQRFHGLSRSTIAAEAAALRPRADGDAVMFATKTAMRMLGRRVLALDDEKAELDELMGRLVADTAPELLALYGVGVDTAAILLVAAGDNPERLRNEPRGPTCAASRRSTRPQARSSAAASTGAATAKRTTPCGASPSLAWAPTPAPATTSNAASVKAAPSPRSSACSSATSHARSTASYPAAEQFRAVGLAPDFRLTPHEGCLANDLPARRSSNTPRLVGGRRAIGLIRACPRRASGPSLSCPAPAADRQETSLDIHRSINRRDRPPPSGSRTCVQASSVAPSHCLPTFRFPLRTEDQATASSPWSGGTASGDGDPEVEPHSLPATQTVARGHWRETSRPSRGETARLLALRSQRRCGLRQSFSANVRPRRGSPSGGARDIHATRRGWTVPEDDRDVGHASSRTMRRRPGFSSADTWFPSGARRGVRHWSRRLPLSARSWLVGGERPCSPRRASPRRPSR